MFLNEFKIYENPQKHTYLLKNLPLGTSVKVGPRVSSAWDMNFQKIPKGNFGGGTVVQACWPTVEP